MIAIRTGASWMHDPRLGLSLRRAEPSARAAAARAVADALAIEVDGFDIAAGHAEGPLLPTLEALLRAVSRVVGGAPHATVPFREGEVELVIRRRGASALLTVVVLTRPSRVLARDVEVDVEALASAALEASAAFCRDLARLLPDGGAREARRLRVAARDLRRTEPAPPPRRARAPKEARPAPPPRRPGRLACAVELADEEAHLLAYDGGRPDLGSLLAPGRVTLSAADGTVLATFTGVPFLALRDLGAAVDRLLAAVRRRDRRVEIALARPGRTGVTTLAVDLEAGRLSVSGLPPVACPPLELARAFAEGAAELGRLARARNPRQGENAYVVELESAAAERIAQIDELAGGDRPAGPGVEGRAPAPPRVSQRPLGPGRLRRLAFRRIFDLDVGRPVGGGLVVRGGLVLAAGADAVVAVERRSGTVLWRAPGATYAAAVPGAFLVARGDDLEALAPRTGRRLWASSSPLAAASGTLSLAHGPAVLAGPGLLVAVDPGSGRPLWRFEPPGATRLSAAAFGGVVVAASDTGLVYGIDVAGRVVWRVRSRGAAVRPPAPALGLAVVLSIADRGAVALAIDPSSGGRVFEAPLDLAPTSRPLAWGSRIVVAGAVAGDAIVAAVERNGMPAWTAAPALSGATSIAVAGALLVARDAAGAIVALARDGTPRWTRPAPPGPPPPGSPSPASARGAVVVAGDGLLALDARTGELLGAVPHVAPVHLSVDADLSVAAMDGDGVATGFRLATHLSVV